MKRERKSGSKWTKEEIRFLKLFYKDYTISKLAEELNKSYGEVYYMMRKLGLKKYPKPSSKMGRPPKYLKKLLDEKEDITSKA